MPLDFLGGAYSRSFLDTDMTDEAAWKARPDMERKWKARQASERKQLMQKVAADKAGVTKASVTVLDTDHSDEEAWKMRKTLANQSKARKAKEAADLAAANKAYRQRMLATKSSDKIDDDLRDESEWLVRPDMAIQAYEKRVREAEDLEVKNAEIKSRLRAIGPKVEVTSEKGVAMAEQGIWIEPFLFRSRDKFEPGAGDEDSAWVRMPGEPRGPSWMPATQKYEWAS